MHGTDVLWAVMFAWFALSVLCVVFWALLRGPRRCEICGRACDPYADICDECFWSIGGAA
jgi:hypothetical protein